jgi:hypothetical protein
MKTSTPETQRAFLKEQASRLSPCADPKCGHKSSLYDACVEEKLDIDDWSTKNTFKCPACQIPMKYTLPWPTGAWHWRLA